MAKSRNGTPYVRLLDGRTLRVDDAALAELRARTLLGDVAAIAELELLAEMLLLGWVNQSGEHRFFQSGSQAENFARNAIQFLLEADRLSTSLRDNLARLFDPNSVFARSVTFGFRREGGPRQTLKHRRIAKEMRVMVRAGSLVQDAVGAASDRYSIDERTARRIWARYGRPMMT